MARLMEIAKRSGHEVSGSDETLLGHSKSNIASVDMVVFSSAIPSDNCELIEAKKRGVAVVERAQFLGAVASGYKKVIAVSGTHGKTTTTAMLSSMLEGYSVTTHIGGEVQNRDGDEIFITEACEYRRSFLSLSPSVGVILNAEFDHPDCYKNEREYREAFCAFANKCETVVVNGDDAFLSRLEHPNKITFGMARGNDFYAREIEKGFSLWYKDIYLGEFAISVLGKHNIYNALAGVVVALSLGASVNTASEGLKKFTGVKRRAEYLGLFNGRAVYSDYAHHPSEIDCALSVFSKATVFFEPHTYSRTRALCGGFVRSLERAERVVLLPVYGAREIGDDETIKELFFRLKKRKLNTVLLSGYDKIVRAITELTRDGDTVVFMGAGTLDGEARKLIR